MFKNVTNKLIFAVVLVTIIIVGSFACINILSLRNKLMHEVIHSANQFSATVIKSTQYDMLKANIEGVHKTIENVGELEGIERIRILNKTGDIVYSSDKNEIGKTVDQKAESCYVCHSGEIPLDQIKERNRIFLSKDYRVLGIITPIYNEKDCYTSKECHVHSEKQRVLGVLDITLSLVEVDRMIFQLNLELLGFAIIEILGISFIIALVTREIVLKPVNLLVKATEKVAEGDFECTIPAASKDEIGILANSFSRMTKELRLAHEKLFQSEKQASLGRLSAGVAHEINNPLTGILMFSTHIQEEVPEDWVFNKELDIIIKETIRCRGIVKGLLDFARQGTANKKNISLSVIINKAIALVQNKARIENIDIKTDIPENLPEAFLDENQIEQVFINLFVNAIDAMPEGGSLTVMVIPKADMLNISVKDTGSGMSDEVLTKVFEPFFTTKSGKGTGLGLAIVWGIIQKHSGKIDIKSEVGKGTEFILSLPLGT